VAADALGELSGDGGVADGALEDGFVEVVSTAFVGDRVEVDACGGEEPLPGPFARSAGVLDAEGVGNLDVAGAAAEIGLVLAAYVLEVGSKRADESDGQRSEAVLFALAVAHANFSSFEVEVFDAESGALEQAQSGAVEERRHEVGGAVKSRQHCCHFRRGEDDWDPFGPLGSKERQVSF
jgi:hypothetical protein